MTLVFANTGKQMGATYFTPCPKWEAFRVDDAKILWEPGVYQGDGTELRVNVCARSDELVERVLEFESVLKGKVCSCVKGEGELQHVKSKLSWDQIKFYDHNHNMIQRPAKLGGYMCNLMYAIKGKWASNGQNGLSLELTHCQILYANEMESKCPFL